MMQGRGTLESFLGEKALCKGDSALAMCCPLEPYSEDALHPGKWKLQSTTSFAGLPDIDLWFFVYVLP